MEKLVINVALTGMVPMRHDTPHVPLTAGEIVADAKRCRDAGASVVHVHARDADGHPTCAREAYAEIIAGIRASCPDLLISATTSGRVHRLFAERSQVLDLTGPLKPDFASLTLGSMNFPKQASINEPQMIHDLAVRMNERGIVPELELFDIGMADYARYLVERGVVRAPLYANILLGSLGTIAATPSRLTAMVEALPSGTTWSAAGIGRFQLFVNSMAITMGGHVRVGLEDNIWFDEARTVHATNPRLVERLVRIAHAAERDVASPADARAIIGLPAQALS